MKRNNKYCPDVSIEECLSEERISENDLLKQIDETLRGCVPDIVKMMQKLRSSKERTGDEIRRSGLKEF